MNVEDHVHFVNNRCSNILDLIAPCKLVNLKHKSQPWMNSDIWALRRQCRQCECRWKKDRLQVSYEMLRDSLRTFQKTAKAVHLSEIIAKNSHCSKTLFSTIDYVSNHPVQTFPELSPLLCANFLKYFVDKLNSD